MDKKISSIQELENIQIKDFIDKPDELIRIGKDLLKAKRYEKSIEVIEEALKQCIKKNNNDVFSIDCAKFYYNYANALIYKLQETGDMFQQHSKKNEEPNEPSSNENNNLNLPNNNISSEETDKLNIRQNKTTNMIDEEEENEDKVNLQNDMKNYEISNDSQEEEDEGEDESDEKIAFYNLAMSEKILKSFLKKYEGIPKAEMPPKIIDYFLDLSDVYMKYGELEQFKSDYKSAFDFFVSSLEILKLYDDPHSRAVAELYYLMGNVADYDARLAMSCFYKTYLIMKKLLMKELKQEINIDIDFTNINKEEVQLDNELLTFKQNDSEEVIDLKGIMIELKQKIEDVTEEIKIMDQLEIEKRNLIQVEFTKKYDESTLIDLNKTGIIKKRKVENSEILKNGSSEKVAKITENGVNKIVSLSTDSNTNEEKEKEIKEENNNK